MEELPQYREREHLKGIDAELIERVRAEVAHVHGPALAGLGLDSKAIVAEGRRGCAHFWFLRFQLYSHMGTSSAVLCFIEGKCSLWSVLYLSKRY